MTKLALAKVWERLQQVKQVQERGGLTEGGMERGGTWFWIAEHRRSSAASALVREKGRFVITGREACP